VPGSSIAGSSPGPFGINALDLTLDIAIRFDAIGSSRRVSSSMSGPSGRAGKRIGCAAIVAAAGVGLGLGVHHDVQLTGSLTTAAYIARVDAQLHQEECVLDAIRLEVPKDAAVYVTAPHSRAGLLLSELSTTWAVPEANIADAQYRLALVGPNGKIVFPFPLTRAAPDPAAGQCEGLTLQVRRR
jgi:hypothetical protein